MDKITDDIYKKVKKYVRQQNMICDKDVIFVGVSGGADSVCLLYILWELAKEIKFDLFVVHVHHGVRKEADDDAMYVEDLCKKLGLLCFIKKVDMLGYAKEMGLSPEEAGRQLRYQAFEAVIEESLKAGTVKDLDKNKCRIAVAHNNNDKAETMLFNLFRGSGLRGLGSIRPVRGNVIRPLLCLKRTEIEAYLKQRKVNFCIDKTNEDDTYTRNKIRRHILPYAQEQICKNAVSHISEAADILIETEDFIQKQTYLAYERCSSCNKDAQKEETNAVILNLNNFLKEEPFLQKMILMHCMEKLTPHRKDITKEHIAALMDLCAKDGSKKFFLPYGLMAYKEYDRLVISMEKEKINKNTQISEEFPPIAVSIPDKVVVKGLGVLEFKYLKKEDFFYKNSQIIPEKTYTKWFDCDKITEILVLRTRKIGDYLTIDSALRKKTLKEYMINEKIPRMQRDNIYLLADGSHILWIPGYRISQYYKVDESTKCILQVHLEEENNG